MTYRRKGVAKKMIKHVMDLFPSHNLFSDLSNKESLPLYLDLGFDCIEENNDFCFVKYFGKKN